MKRLLFVSLCALTLGLAVASTAHAAADYFLKLDGIDGETASRGNEGSLSVESFSFGASQSSSWTKGGGASVGKPQPGTAMAATAEPPAGSGALRVVKQYDKSSPLLAKACATGQHIKSATLTRCQDGACKTYEFQDVLVSSYSVSNDGKGGVTEQLSLRYHEWRWRNADASSLRESPTLQSTGTTATPTKPKSK
jgi:type VI secretion system secreted protein Hcp